jgi:XRE family transcriptional regulator, aerobic/anaerobic benzoate catabolism transcriptional regulator
MGRSPADNAQISTHRQGPASGAGPVLPSAQHGNCNRARVLYELCIMMQNSDTHTNTDSELIARDVDTTVTQLLGRVGARVRATRKRMGFSRRILSEKSGVSPRYLAQLEAGEGNISIGLLQRVALALDCRIDWLICEVDPWASDSTRAHRICLIGLRGAGKSTLGALAGEALGIPFVETNGEIEDLAGMPVAEVMALCGQDGYRRLEAQAVRRIVATHDSVVIAAAGGIVTEQETYDALLRNFHTVWLATSPEEHMSRVREQGDERPMAGNPEAMAQLKSILASREALHAKALVRLDTSATSVDQSIAALLDLIKEQKFLM